MSKFATVATYVNDSHRCFSQLKLASGERILVSIATQPYPSTRVTKQKMGGLVPGPTIWEYNAQMAGGYQAYVENLMLMFAESSEATSPLDAICKGLSSCESVEDVRTELLGRESFAHAARQGAVGARPPAQETGWYYVGVNQETGTSEAVGPFNHAQMVRWIENGFLLPDSQVWHASLGKEWRKAAEAFPTTNR